MRRLIFCVCLLATAARADDVGMRVLPSLVKVIAVCGAGTARVATGFVWGDRQVVTDLHVVVGCAPLTVLYFVRGPNGLTQTTREAAVARVLRAADLALLTVKNPPDAPALSLAAKPPAAEDWVEAWGFPLGVEAPINTRLQVTFANDLFPQLSSTLDDTARSQLTALAFPDLTSEVLHLSGPLQPGDSGAPVVDAAGGLVGIGSGGLQQGAASISWAMRARYLPQLMLSNDPVPTAGGSGALFATITRAVAQGVPTAPPGVTCGEARLTLRGTRRFGEIAGEGGQMPLYKLASLKLDDAALAKLAFDLWVEPGSGATVAVPEGVALAAGPDHCRAALGPGAAIVVTTRVLPENTATPEWWLAVGRDRWRALRVLSRVAQAGLHVRPNLPAWSQSAQPVVNGALVRRTVEGTAAGTVVYRVDLDGRGLALTVGVVAERTALAGPDHGIGLAAASLATFPPLDATAATPVPAAAPTPAAATDDDDAPTAQPEGFASVWCGGLVLLMSEAPEFGALAARAADPGAIVAALRTMGVSADRIARLRYDVWAAAASGIAVPMPRGARIEQADHACRFTSPWDGGLGAILVGKAPDVPPDPTALASAMAMTLNGAEAMPGAGQEGVGKAWRLTGMRDGHAFRVVARRQEREGWAVLSAWAVPDGADLAFALRAGAALVAPDLTAALDR